MTNIVFGHNGGAEGRAAVGMTLKSYKNVIFIYIKILVQSFLFVEHENEMV